MVSSALLRAFVQEPSISPNEQLDSLCARQDISEMKNKFKNVKSRILESKDARTVSLETKSEYRELKAL